MRSSESFLAIESGVTPTTLAPELWVDFQIHPNDAGIEQFYTYGMNVFGKCEIEIDRFSLSHDAMLNYGKSVAKDILESDLELANGSFVEGPAGKPVRVTHGKSFLGYDDIVCKVQLE